MNNVGSLLEETFTRLDEGGGPLYDKQEAGCVGIRRAAASYLSEGVQGQLYHLMRFDTTPSPLSDLWFEISPLCVAVFKVAPTSVGGDFHLMGKQAAR